MQLLLIIMHLVLFFTFDYSLITWLESGHLTRELKFYNYLVSRGIKVSFVTYGDKQDLNVLNNSRINVIPIYNLINKSNYKIINILKSIFIPFRLIKVLNLESKNLIVKQNQLLGSWVSIIFKLISKSKLYTRTGYDMYLFSIKDRKNIYKRFLYLILTQVTLLFSDRYSVTSNSDALFLKKKFFATKNIVVRPNWVDEGFGQNDRKYKNTLLAVGRLEKQKGFHDLLNSLKNTGFELDIYGEGTLKQELMEISTKLCVSLRIYENIENEELLDIYKQYKYFVSSAIFEGNSKVILEAMANGCIVIAKDIENNREIIDDCNSGLLYTNNLHEILIKLQNEKYDDQKFLKNASNKIKETYSKDIIFTDYFLDFEKLLQSK
jgi:glycosyltransferase involved in cell wall biosynthesis